MNACEVAGWVPVLWWPSAKNHISDWRAGQWVKLLRVLDPINTAVKVEAEDKQLSSIHVPWSERPAGFSEVLSCEAFQLLALVSHSVPTWYALLVDNEACKAHLAASGTLPSQVAVTEVMKASYRIGRLPRRVEVRQMLPHVGDERTHWGSVELFETQFESVAWMTEIERQVRLQKCKVTYDLDVPLGDTGWSFDTNAERFVQRSSTRCRSLTCRGGVLSDATGSGKTAVVLKVICESLKSRPPCAAPQVLTSDASLVVVPAHLYYQWCDEIAKFTHGLTVVTLGCRDSLQRATLRDLVDADVVVCSSHIPRSGRYATLLASYVEHLGVSARAAASMHQKNVSAMCAALIEARQLPLSEVPPILEFVRFDRIVVDELHEHCGTAKDFRLFDTLSANVWWGMTGTPSMSPLQSVFLIDRDKCDFSPHCNMHAAVESSLVKRNAYVPDIQIEVHAHSVRLTAIEHVVTKARSDCSLEERIRNLTYGTQFEDAVGVAADSVSTARFFESQISELDQRLRSCQASLASAAAEMEEDTSKISAIASAPMAYAQSRIVALKDSVRACKRKLKAGALFQEKLRRRLDAVKQQFAFFRERVRALDEHGEECPVCLGDVDCITACGHAFCTECIRKLVRGAHFSCPICREHLKATQVAAVAPRRPGAHERCTSKMRAAGEFVRSIVDRGEKVLVAVQWKKCAAHSRSVLEAHGVPVLCLEGSPAKQAEELVRFRDLERGAALIMVLETSNTGLSIQFCSQIVFLHLCCAGEAVVTSMEGQAIGRLVRRGQLNTVHVHHFIGRDTEEDVAWLNSHDCGHTCAQTQ